MDFYKKFIKDEYDWIFDFGSDSSSMIFDEFKDSISDEEFENNFELFKTKATEIYINDDYYIQQLHEQMDDCLREVLHEYIENKEDFIENNKTKDCDIEKEIYEEVESAYKTITRYNKSKEIIQELSSKDESCPEWLSNIFK